MSLTTTRTTTRTAKSELGALLLDGHDEHRQTLQSMAFPSNSLSSTVVVAVDPGRQALSTSSSPVLSSEGCHDGNNSDCCLSRPLWWLYYLHGGFSQSMPTTAILYLMNTHVVLPLSLIPTYTAIMFLPFSFKPIYAYLASCHQKFGMDKQLPWIMVLNAIVVSFTAFVPKHGVMLLMLLGFLRGLSTAWPELLMGLSLVDEANAHHRRSSRAARESKDDGDDDGGGDDDDDDDNYGEAAARMQAQAATARNLGSVTAYVVALVLLASHDYCKLQRPQEQQQQRHPHGEPTLESAFLLLGMTSFAIVIAALIAFWNQVGKQPADTRIHHSAAESERIELCSRWTPNAAETENLHDNQQSAAIEEHENVQPTTLHWRNRETVMVILLQMAVILLALRQPLGLDFSILTIDHGVWFNKLSIAFFGICFMVMIALSSRCCSSHVFARAHRVGLFLTLRHVVPNSGFLMESFRYFVFSKTPFLLQLLSLMDMIVLTGASWSFGRWFSGYSSGRKLIWLIAVTTFLSGISSLSYLWMIQVSQTVGSTLGKFMVASVTGALCIWLSEWSFLPEVVLATVTLNKEPSPAAPGTVAVHTPRTSYVELPCDDNMYTEEAMTTISHQSDDLEKDGQRRKRGVQYGTFITCIDFGDQLGALVSGAVVSAFGITRENDWNHLDQYIFLCALLVLASTCFLVLLR
ncbi:hypothetical protein ACA910_006032 [Epithemia clementina (nom. ined.)]